MINSNNSATDKFKNKAIDYCLDIIKREDVKNMNIFFSIYFISNVIKLVF